MTRTHPTALVTGATSGIGLALARRLAASGHDLVLTARRSDALGEVARELAATHRVQVATHALDLGVPGAAHRLWAAIEAAGRPVDLLVNNAGAGANGAFAELDGRAAEAMIDLNVTALTVLARLALPGMLARGHGGILNVASVAGFQPGGPGMAVYYATKAYVISLTRALAMELRGSGVNVTALCPGPTATGFAAAADAHAIRLFRVVPGLPADTVAAVGLRALAAGRVLAIPGLLARIMATAGALPPAALGLVVNRWLLGPVQRATPTRPAAPA